MACLESFVLHIVALLLHIVRDIDFGHSDLSTTGDGKLFICFLLADLGHFLPSSIVLFAFLDKIVALSLLQKSLLLYAIHRNLVNHTGRETYSKPSIFYFLFNLTIF